MTTESPDDDGVLATIRAVALTGVERVRNLFGDHRGAAADRANAAAAAARRAAPDRRTLLTVFGSAAGGAILARGGSLATDLRTLVPGPGIEARDVSVADNAALEQALELVPREAATHRAVRSGPWDEPLVWDGGVPDDGARVLIEKGVEVTLRHQATTRHEWVRVDGALVVDPATDTHLGAGTVVTAPGSHLQIGTASVPVGPDSEAAVTFLDRGPIDESRDPDRVGRGLLAMGSVSIRGAEKTAWTALSAAPSAGDRALELDGAPTNWESGDRLVVPGMAPDRNEDEEVVVEAVNGATVELDRALTHDHAPPADDLDAYVLNLDRYVVLRSESDETPRRGHLMFMATGAQLGYAAMAELGRTDKSYPFTNPIHGKPPKDVPPNPRARYACHFHRTGIDADRPHRVVGCVVRGSPGWGIVNHGSHAHVVDSVTYQVFGAGFVAEAGNERGSFRRNFALRSVGSGELLDTRAFHSGDDDLKPGEVDDFGHGGHGFWLQGPAVAVENNVAAGHRYYGIVFWNRPLVDRPLQPGERIDRLRGTVANFPLEFVDGQQPLKESDHVDRGAVSSAYVRLRSVSGNTVFASGGGLDVSRHQFGWAHTRVGEWSEIEDLTVFNVGSFTTHWGKTVEPDFANRCGGNAALCVRYSNNLRIRSPRFVSGQGRAGVGINRNVPYPFHVSVEDGSIAGFDRGIHTTVRGITRIAGTRLANRRNIVVEDEHRHPTRQVLLRDLTLAGGRGDDVALELAGLEDTSPRELFAVRSGVTLDGREVFFAKQRPGYVPVPDREALQQLGGRNQLAALTDGDPDGVVGKTNRELYREYGFATKGRPTPGWAGADPRVDGALESAAHADTHTA